MSDLWAERLVHITALGTPKPDESCRGPTSTSCWIVPGVVLWGDTPKGAKAAVLMECGVTHMLDVRSSHRSPDMCGCLQAYRELDVQHLMSSNTQAAIASCAATIKSVLVEVLGCAKGVLYVHCEDGNSSSGIVACAILAYVYSLSGMKAAAIASQLHGCRADTSGVAQLLNPQQKAFVRDVAKDGTPWQQLPAAPASAVRGNGALPESPSALARVGSSRFSASRGGGGGFTSINLFGESCADEVATPQCQGSRARVHEQQLPPKPTAAAVVDSPPRSALRSPAASSTPRTSPKQPVEVLQQSGVAPSVATLQRSTLAHAWGIVLDGNTVRHVLPMSPADQAGVAVGCIVRAIDNGEFSGEDSFDWITQDRLTITLSIQYPGNSSFPRGDRKSPPTPLMQEMIVVTEHPHEFDQSGVISPIFDSRTEQTSIRGPWPQANWVIRDRVLCGPLPDPRKRQAFAALLKTGIDVYVSLLEVSAPNEAYMDAVLEHHRTALHGGSRAPPVLVWCPLEDGAPVPASQFATVLALAHDILRWSVTEGKRVYIHCRNGHGRTGIVVSCLLACAYHLSGMRAVNLCDALHSCRLDTEDQSSPQTQEQRLCVVSLLGKSFR